MLQTSRVSDNDHVTPEGVEEDENEFQTDAVTVAGRKIVIVVTPTGYYRIVAKGPGDSLKLSEETFTNLLEARKALSRFVLSIEPTVNKKKLHQAAIERRIAAHDG